MALVSVTEAAILVRKGRATLYRDIEKGRLSKSVSPTGETGIETSELVRVYGVLHLPETEEHSHETTAVEKTGEVNRVKETGDASENVSKSEVGTSGDKENAVLRERLRAYEQRVELLERIVELEKSVRQDTTAALRAQLADKEIVLKTLEGQLLMLTYEKPAERTPTKKGFLRRLFNTR